MTTGISLAFDFSITSCKRNKVNISTWILRWMGRFFSEKIIIAIFKQSCLWEKRQDSSGSRRDVNRLHLPWLSSTKRLLCRDPVPPQQREALAATFLFPPRRLDCPWCTQKQSVTTGRNRRLRERSDSAENEDQIYLSVWILMETCLYHFLNPFFFQQKQYNEWWDLMHNPILQLLYINLKRCCSHSWWIQPGKENKEGNQFFVLNCRLSSVYH